MVSNTALGNIYQQIIRLSNWNLIRVFRFHNSTRKIFMDPVKINELPPVPRIEFTVHLLWLNQVWPSVAKRSGFGSLSLVSGHSSGVNYPVSNEQQLHRTGTCHSHTLNIMSGKGSPPRQRGFCSLDPNLHSSSIFYLRLCGFQASLSTSIWGLLTRVLMYG